MKRYFTFYLLFLILLSGIVLAVPSISITAPSDALKNQEITFSVETSSDSDIDRIEIDYGDTSSEQYECSSGLSCSHDFVKSYFNKESYIITVTVYDATSSDEETHSLEIITPNPPEIDISPTSINAQKDEDFSFTVVVSDIDFDFNSMKIYQDDILIETLLESSSECNSQGCTKAYNFALSEEKTYTYKIEADDDDSHLTTETIDVVVEQDVPVVEFFKIETAQAGIDESVSVQLGSKVTFRARATSAEYLQSIDVEKGIIDCGGIPACENVGQYTFNELGEFSYSAQAITVSGRRSAKSDSILLKVVCPKDNECCDAGNTFWNPKPENKTDGCDIGKYKTYICTDQGVSTFELTGTDNDNDQFDQECFDCDDSNKEIYPTNPNPFCDCDLSSFVKTDSELICDDNQDNDCDGKIDCFDEDCPSYDPINCKLECPPGETKCPQGYCANLNKDTDNCGVCENSCQPFLNTLMKCDFGVCLVDSCEKGFENCDVSEPDCEVNILRDPNNCGSCGKECPSSYSCREGKCKKINIDDTSWKTETCYHGESIDCVTGLGCLGKRYCDSETEKYTTCECEPYIKILSPNKKTYSTNNLSLKIETNMIIEKCELSINSKNYQVLKKTEMNYLFDSGNNTIILDCSKGLVTALFNFNIDLPEKNKVWQTVSDEYKVLPRNNQVPERFNREEYYKLLNILEEKQEYSYQDDKTEISFKLMPERYLNNMELYLQIPDCVSIEKVIPKDGNFEKFNNNTLFWKYSQVNGLVELNVLVDDKIDERCVGLFVVAPIVETIGKKIGFSYWGYIPIIFIPLLGIFLYSVSQVWHNRNQNIKNENNLEDVIVQKKKDGESDIQIKQELEQDEINDNIINESMQKEKKDEQQDQV